MKIRPLDRQSTEHEKAKIEERYHSRERLKVLGILLIAFLILILAFVRFGKTIPWGAR